MVRRPGPGGRHRPRGPGGARGRAAAGCQPRALARALLAELDSSKDPVALATAVWQATELAPIVLVGRTLGVDELSSHLARLTASKVPFAAGEARLALARLPSAEPRAPALVRADALAAGVLGDGRVLGPRPGPGAGEAPPAADA
ncbi:MAG: hypothetical protein U1F43_11570 [Myxococcota bacterium]